MKDIALRTSVGGNGAVGSALCAGTEGGAVMGAAAVFRAFCVIALLFVMIAGCGGAGSVDTAVPPELRKQVAKLRLGSPGQKVSAARELGKMGEKAGPSVPYLLELIDSPEHYETLWDKILNALVIFHVSRTGVKDEAQKALVTIGKPSVRPLSGVLVSHPRPRLRYNAAIVLGKIKDLQSVDALVAALMKDTDFEVRMWSADALGKFSEKWSADALGSAVPALMEALGDKDPNVRQKAAYALGSMKAAKAVPALIQALRTYGKDSDAGLALFMITGQRFQDDPQKWQEWWKENKPRE